MTTTPDQDDDVQVVVSTRQGLSLSEAAFVASMAEIDEDDLAVLDEDER
jgi:hypothetical protein